MSTVSNVRSLTMLALAGCTAAGPAVPPHDAGPPARDASSTAVDAGPAAIDAFVPDASCADVHLEAQTSQRPIDIIIWVDDGGSFDSARRKVSSSISDNLVAILEAAGVDYQVILLSANTSIGPPLSESAERYFHVPGGYSAGGGGYVFFSDASYLSRYLDRLRPDAFKVFLSATDCESEAGSFAAFEDALAMNGAGAFVVGDERNFVYNMIGNVALGAPPTTPWSSGDPPAGRGSYGGFTSCQNTQEGAITTGGLRLGVAAPDYDALFQAIADESITQASVPCSLEVPEGPDISLDIPRAQLRYQPGGGGEPIGYDYVESMDACADGGFYLAGDHLELCPSTCETIRADPDAMVDFSFPCGLI
ncbi:MAG: hypothetical protein AB7S26_05810 [Sandaracinaceae bacterium]